MNKYIMEFVGTFFLALAIVLTGNPFSIGLMFGIMFYIGNHISGGHYNPAVSLMMFMKKRISMNDYVFYITAQTLGALGAGFVYLTITRSVFAPDVIPGMPFTLTAGLEGMLTMVFCWTVWTVVTNGKYSSSGIDGLIAGFGLMALGFIGGLFNPAVALSSVILGVFKGGALMLPQNIIIFVVMPMIAGMITPYIDGFLKDKM